MNRFNIKNETDGLEFLFVHDNEKFAWIVDSNTHQLDSAWKVVSELLIKQHELEERWISATRFFHIEEVISADISSNGEWIAKYDGQHNDPILFNEDGTIDRSKSQVVSLFIQLNDVTLSSLEFDIKLDKALRIITTFGMMQKSQIASKPLDVAHPNQDLNPKEETAQNSDCFVATAVYGNPYHPNVIKLRTYRDNRLTHSFWGRLFIKIYYKIGPYLAILTKKISLLDKFFKSLIEKIAERL